MTTALAEVMGAGIDVPVVGGGCRPYVNLDDAATTPVFAAVWKRLSQVLPLYGSVNRGAGYKSLLSTRFIEEAKTAIFSFCDASTEDDVLQFGVNTTSCVNHLARRLCADSKPTVLVSELEHTSNLLPWMKHANVLRFRTSSEEEVDLNHLEDLLKRNRVQLVVTTAASNVTGQLVDVHQVARIAHAHGARVFVDAAQFVAHRRIDRRRNSSPEHLDYLSFAAHKMYAPFGIGVLVGPRDTYTTGWPDQPGGGAVTYLDDNGLVWARVEEREQGGTPNFPGIIALSEACKVLKQIGFDKIEEHETSLIRCAAEHIGNLPHVDVYHPLDARRHDYLPVFSFRVHVVPHDLVAAYLGYERAIGVRSGNFCQYSLVARLLGIPPAEQERVHIEMKQGRLRVPHGIVRASCGLDTSFSDLEALGEALRHLTARGPSAKYVQNAFGDYRPEDWPEAEIPVLRDE